MNDKIEISKDLDDVSNAVAAINATEAGIAELKKKYQNVVFDVSDTNGMTEAKQARAEIREPRYNIENLRKAAKVPILALGRNLDARAAEMTARILELETPVDDVIKAEEKRKEDERLAKIKAEEDRVNAIKERIAELHESVLKITTNAKASSEYVDLCISGFLQLTIDDGFAEFKADAQLTYDSGLAALEAHSRAMAEREAAEKKAAEDAAELEKLRKEKADREAEEKRKADIKAELDRKAAEVKPIEEQLAAIPGPVPAVVVGHQPKPYVRPELTMDLGVFSKRFLEPAMTEIASKAHSKVYQQLIDEGLDPDSWVRGHNLLREKLGEQA